MERRVLLAIFLSFLVLYLYQALVVKPVVKPGSVAGRSSSSPSAPSNPTVSAELPRAGGERRAERASREALARPGAATHQKATAARLELLPELLLELLLEGRRSLPS